MRIILIRHGQTKANMQRRYNGRTDEPLCAEGILQAQTAGILDSVTYVYVSPMERAKQTAKTCFPNAQMHIIEDFREMDFGDFEGRTADEMVCDAAYREWVNESCRGQCPNGEDRDSFQLRVLTAFDFIVHHAFERRLKEPAVVAHGGTIMEIMSQFAKPAQVYYDWHVPNCSGYEIFIDEDVWEEAPHFIEHKYLERLK